MISYKDWKKEYFFKGKTIPIYLLLFNFLVFASYLIYYHNNLIVLLFALMGTISNYAVFTDLYAHLWKPEIIYNITLKQWLQKFVDFRTHDVYGVGFSFIAVLGIGIEIHSIFLVILFVSSALVLYYIVHTRFYH